MAAVALSPRNPRIREVRRLLQDGRLRKKSGLWVLEGHHLAEEAVKASLPVRLWVLTPQCARRDALQAGADARGEDSVLVSEETFAGLSDTRTPQGVLCVVEAPDWDAARVLGGAGPVVALDGIQDPGNLGTLVRSAEAAGASGLLLGRSCVDAGNGKALRASAGSLLRLPVVAVDDLPNLLKESGAPVYSTSGHGGTPYDEVDLAKPFVLLIGQEGRGLSSEALAASTLTLTIPMVGSVESLNAATAASVILFEALRQRRQKLRSS